MEEEYSQATLAHCTQGGAAPRIGEQDEGDSRRQILCHAHYGKDTVGIHPYAHILRQHAPSFCAKKMIG